MSRIEAGPLMTAMQEAGYLENPVPPAAERWIATFIEARLPRPRTLVFGIMGDKNIDAVTRKLFPLFDLVITTEPYPPRNESAESLARAGVLAPGGDYRGCAAGPAR